MELGLPFEFRQISMNRVTKDNRAPSVISYLSTSGFKDLHDAMVRVECFMRVCSMICSMCSNDQSEPHTTRIAVPDCVSHRRMIQQE